MEYQVPSSDGSSMYVVTINKIGNAITSSCSCKAGMFGQLCKHQIGILSGDDSCLLPSDSSGHEMLKALIAEIAGTECAAQLNEYLGAQAAIEEQKKRRDRAKKNLERILKI